ncbi:MAG: radical SAM protein [Lentisphaerales bacterium]|nr:radical SAM protein [Lentisphaerales bacterium]
MSLNKHIKNSRGLIDNGLVDDGILQTIEKVTEKFSVSISQGIHNNPAPEVLEQYVPSVEELSISAEELADPIGDDVYTPIKGITHRYPDRVLLKAVHVCEVYCRFCFRREKVGRGKEILSQSELDIAIQYIEQNEQIFEVILSGGDPLVLHPAKLKEIVERLSKIEHVAVIRIHTRLPMASPEKVTEKLIDALETEKAVFVVLHCNSHEEVTVEVKAALKRFFKMGIPLLSQSVLLKGINDCE